jgi:ACR3 family arsenite efflux pump ArsB
MILRASDIAQYSGKNEPRIMVMSIVEFLIYPALILAMCWLVSRFYPRLRHEA